MSKLFLVYRVDCVSDHVNGDGIHPLWLCDSEDKAKSDIKKLQIEFDVQKKEMNLSHSMVYFYMPLSVF